jgi:hypothetical protein
MQELILVVVLRSAPCALQECTQLPLKDLVFFVKLRINVLEGSVNRVMMVPFPLVTLRHVPHAPVARIVRTIAFTSVHLHSLA